MTLPGIAFFKSFVFVVLLMIRVGGQEGKVWEGVGGGEGGPTASYPVPPPPPPALCILGLLISYPLKKGGTC